MRLTRILGLAIISLTLLTAGCSSNNKGKIEGTKWSSNPGVVKGQQLQAGAFKLEFKSDGTMVYNNPRGRFTGTYSLGMSDYVTWNLDRELGGLKTHSERVSINGNTMTITDSDGTQLSFTKQ